jgi:protein-tyrosine phosphatase
MLRTRSPGPAGNVRYYKEVPFSYQSQEKFGRFSSHEKVATDEEETALLDSEETDEQEEGETTKKETNKDDERDERSDAEKLLNSLLHERNQRRSMAQKIASAQRIGTFTYDPMEIEDDEPIPDDMLCEECEKKLPTLHCSGCTQIFCTECFEMCHRKKAFALEGQDVHEHIVDKLIRPAKSTDVSRTRKPKPKFELPDQDFFEDDFIKVKDLSVPNTLYFNKEDAVEKAGIPHVYPKYICNDIVLFEDSLTRRDAFGLVVSEWDFRHGVPAPQIIRGKKSPYFYMVELLGFLENDSVVKVLAQSDIQRDSNNVEVTKKRVHTAPDVDEFPQLSATTYLANPYDFLRAKEISKKVRDILEIQKYGPRKHLAYDEDVEGSIASLQHYSNTFVGLEMLYATEEDHRDIASIQSQSIVSDVTLTDSWGSRGLNMGTLSSRASRKPPAKSTASFQKNGPTVRRATDEGKRRKKSIKIIEGPLDAGPSLDSLSTTTVRSGVNSVAVNSQESRHHSSPRGRFEDDTASLPTMQFSHEDATQVDSKSVKLDAADVSNIAEFMEQDGTASASDVIGSDVINYVPAAMTKKGVQIPRGAMDRHLYHALKEGKDAHYQLRENVRVIGENELVRPRDKLQQLADIRFAFLADYMNIKLKRFFFRLLHAAFLYWQHGVVAVIEEERYDSCVKIQSCYRRYSHKYTLSWIRDTNIKHMARKWMKVHRQFHLVAPDAAGAVTYDNILYFATIADLHRYCKLLRKYVYVVMQRYNVRKNEALTRAIRKWKAVAAVATEGKEVENTHIQPWANDDEGLREYDDFREHVQGLHNEFRSKGVSAIGDDYGNYNNILSLPLASKRTLPEPDTLSELDLQALREGRKYETIYLKKGVVEIVKTRHVFVPERDFQDPNEILVPPAKPCMGLDLPPLPNLHKVHLPNFKGLNLAREKRVTEYKYRQHAEGPTEESSWVIPRMLVMGRKPTDKKDSILEVRNITALSKLLMAGVGVFVSLMPEEEEEQIDTEFGLQPITVTIKKELELARKSCEDVIASNAQTIDVQTIIIKNIPRYMEIHPLYEVAQRQRVRSYGRIRRAKEAIEETKRKLKQIPACFSWTRFPLQPEVAPALHEISPVLWAIENHLAKGNRVFVYSKDGHGRVGLVCGAILGRLYGLPINDTLVRMQATHDSAPVEAERPVRISCPQSPAQRKLLADLLGTTNRVYELQSKRYFLNPEVTKEETVTFNDDERKVMRSRERDRVKKLNREVASPVMYRGKRNISSIERFGVDRGAEAGEPKGLFLNLESQIPTEIESSREGTAQASGLVSAGTIQSDSRMGSASVSVSRLGSAMFYKDGRMSSQARRLSSSQRAMSPNKAQSLSQSRSPSRSASRFGSPTRFGSPNQRSRLGTTESVTSQIMSFTKLPPLQDALPRNTESRNGFGKHGDTEFGGLGDMKIGEIGDIIPFEESSDEGGKVYSLGPIDKNDISNFYGKDIVRHNRDLIRLWAPTRPHEEIVSPRSIPHVRYRPQAVKKKVVPKTTKSIGVIMAEQMAKAQLDEIFEAERLGKNFPLD